jgi:hypothetical protein
VIPQNSAGLVVAGSALTTEEHDQLMALPSKEEIADQTWDEALSGHQSAGSTGEALSEGQTPVLLLDTTIASVISQTEFTLASGSDIDNSYKDQAVTVYDASNNDYPSVRKCIAYLGGTKRVTLDSAPDFTIIEGDATKIFVASSASDAPTTEEIADAVWDAPMSEHMDEGSTGERLYEGGEGSGSTEMTRLELESCGLKATIGIEEENFKILEQRYADGDMTYARIRSYNSKADCDADENPVAEWCVLAVYSPAKKRPQSYKVTKETF